MREKLTSQDSIRKQLFNRNRLAFTLPIVVFGGLASGLLAVGSYVYFIDLWPLDPGPQTDELLLLTDFNPITALLATSAPGWIFFLVHALVLDKLGLARKPIRPLGYISILFAGGVISTLTIMYSSFLGISRFSDWSLFLIGFGGAIASLASYHIFWKRFRLSFALFDMLTFAVLGYASIVFSFRLEMDEYRMALVGGALSPMTIAFWHLAMTLAIALTFFKRQKWMQTLTLSAITALAFFLLHGATISEWREFETWRRASDELDTKSMMKVPGASEKINSIHNRDVGTSLHSATKTGNVQVLKDLLTLKPDLNTINHDGHTPLMLTNDLEVARLLLEAGADPNFSNVQRLSPMFETRDTNMLALLMEYGGDLSKPNSYGFLPIVYAVMENNFELVSFMVKHGSPLDRRGPQGHFVIGHSENVEMAEHLETLGALVQEQMSVTPAYANNDPELLKFFLDRGLRGNTQSKELRRSNVHIIKLLLEHGADPNYRHVNKQTVIENQSMRGNTEIVKLLLEYGADPTKPYPDVSNLSSIENDTIREMLEVHILRMGTGTP